jgi:2-polyprenyl-6-methoxyphenol hydroxylase-like FAD-dependent oxidoreductase
LNEAFDDFGGAAREAFAELGEDLHFGGAQEIDRDEWRSGRVILIGDAAHACSPVLTQGGSLAIEDAIVLADRLASAGLAESASTTRPDPHAVDQALSEFVHRREPRARWIRESTRRYIQLMNRGASAIDLTSSLTEVSAFLREPI